MTERTSTALVNQLVIAFNNNNHNAFRQLAMKLVEDFPTLYVGWKALGVSKLRSGDPAEALKNLTKANKLFPDDAECLKYIADAQRSLGLISAAEESYVSAIGKKPNYAEAHQALGDFLISLGRYTESESALRRSIALKPSFFGTYMSLGAALEHLNRPTESKEFFTKAATLAPGDSRVHYNLARFLQVQGDLDGAERAYQSALNCDPENTQVLVNLSETLKDLGRVEEALAICERVVAREPTHATAHWNRSLLQLRMGHFERGWQEYEWRWKHPDFPTKELRFDRPKWLGHESLKGKSILVHAEQGLGDTIQFCRYIKFLTDAGAVVLFAPQKQLAALMKYIQADCQIVDVNDKALCFDYHTPLLSLPLSHRTETATIPNAVPYLRADAARINYWKRRMGSHGFKIGVCWQGNVGQLDRGRSFPLACMFGISRIPGVRLFSLLKGDGHPLIQDPPDGMYVETFGEELDRGHDAFLDTAAVMKVCDLVITSDTAIAHLGGALGVTTWLALKSVPDWRWMLGRSDSPWYPSLRLFRQKSRGNWAHLFDEMESEIRALA